MKALALLAALALPLIAHAADYSGTWSLDKAKSTNLPPYYAQIQSHTLTNAQTAQTLKVAIAIQREGAPVDTVTIDYRLDGTPIQGRAMVRTPQGMQEVPTSMVTRIDNAGQVHIAVTRETPGAAPVTSTEDWTLSPDAQTLTVHLVRGPQASDLVFRRR